MAWHIVTFLLTIILVVWTWPCFRVIEGKVFRPCELGRILLEQGVEFEMLGDWICLAYAASRYDSSMIGGQDTNPYNNFQYGIYQISNYYHCYDIYKPVNNECGLNCTDLIDDELVDDIRCAKLIYRRGGNSFKPWNQFAAKCNKSDNNNAEYYRSCDFANGVKAAIEGEHETNVTLYLNNLTPGEVVVQCQASGTLPIEIKWTKNRKPYSLNDPDFQVVTSVDNSTNLTISTVSLLHVNFTLNEYVTLLTCEAQNKYGQDTADFLVKIVEPPIDGSVPPPNSSKKAMELGLTILVTTIIILTAAVVVYIYVLRDKNGLTASELELFRNGDDSETILVQTDEYINETLVSKPYNSDFEILKRDLKIEKRDLLGSGQFGLVYKGIYHEKTVAVKTLKPNAEKMYLKALLSELKVLIYVKGHGNVIEVIGAYTKELQRGILFVLLEFCPLGSLLEYLQNYRYERDHRTGVQVQVTFDSGSGNDPSRNVTINAQNMGAWSYQIASAMEYLSAKKVIHGDLATRNILLKTPEIIKITDFGLSQKLYNYSTYVKGEDAGPLPWRWLAPETLLDLKFSASSDVWSFGVTLWEIYSYAQIPYAGLNWSSDFVRLLENGLRLTKPDEASSSLFQIMETCWKLDPLDRPTFTLLRQQFCLEVAKFSKVDYIDLNVPLSLQRSPPTSQSYRTVEFIA